eukprot:INCI13252.1.p2 GENE.INCI13252.1~~INCI13252.1.p2  ORF type:complete len:106 (-),score=4.31 INCI13252.1:21-338(-)
MSPAQAGNAASPPLSDCQECCANHLSVACSLSVMQQQTHTCSLLALRPCHTLDAHTLAEASYPAYGRALLVDVHFVCILRATTNNVVDGERRKEGRKEGESEARE